MDASARERGEVSRARGRNCEINAVSILRISRRLPPGHPCLCADGHIGRVQPTKFELVINLKTAKALSALLSVLAPLSFSENTRSQPSALSVASWASSATNRATTSDLLLFVASIYLLINSTRDGHAEADGHGP